MTEPASDRAPLRVLVVDADDRTRESLAGLLSIGRRCIVVGTAGHPLEALAQLAEFSPDVIVVDPRLPEVDSGRAFIARVHELSPATRVLVMAWSDSLEQDGLVNGADAFVRKTFRPRELVDAVEAASGRRAS
jgi:DNA-binding NarL/FixJ family response regulator